MSIRTYREGDEDEIAKLLSECFGSFKSFGLTGEKWRRFFEIDPGYRKDLSFVAEKDGRIVSHVQIVERKMKVAAGATLSVAGIANVSTTRDFRRSGISTRLLNHALGVVREKGFLVSALFTGAQIPAHRIYLRLGFSGVCFQVMLLRGVKTPLGWTNDQTRQGSLGKRIETRESVEKDDTSLLRVYEKNYDSYNGLAVRDKEMWKTKYRDRFVYESPFYEEDLRQGNMIVAEGEDGNIVGYGISGLAKRDKLGHICEVLTTPGYEKQAGRPIAESILSHLRNESPLSIIAYSSENILIDDLFRKGSSPLTGISVFMLKTLDLKVTMQSSLQHFYSKRGEQRESTLPHLKTIAVKILGGGSVTLKLEPGNVTVLEDQEKKEGSVMFLDDDSFAKLLFGAKSSAELINEGKLKMPTTGAKRNEIVGLLENAFPRKPTHTFPGDIW
ncbi:MAG: GNAT family N-acetyltransferase [Candidatus Atabeyarchaeum deiterrae]